MLLATAGGASLRQIAAELDGPDYALRVQAGRVLVQISVQRSRLLGLYQQEGATDNAPQDFLEFLEEFWERRRLGEGQPISDIVPKESKNRQTALEVNWIELLTVRFTALLGTAGSGGEG